MLDNWATDPTNMEFRLTRLKHLQSIVKERDAKKKELKAKHDAELKELEAEFSDMGLTLDERVENERRTIKGLMDNWGNQPFECDFATVVIANRKNFEVASMSEMVKHVAENSLLFTKYFDIKKSEANKLLKELDENSVLPEWAVSTYNPVMTITFKQE